MRSLIGALTRRLVFPRRLPREFGAGRVWVSTAAGLRFLFRRSEHLDANLFALAREFVGPGDAVWDIGADVGLFSFAAAHRAGAGGSVLAVEPDPWLAGLLRRTVASTRHGAAVTVLPAAAAGSCGPRTLEIARSARAMNALSGFGYTPAGSRTESVTVEAVSLDWLATQRPLPAVVKIDVEGAEFEVLSGARVLLRTHRPVVLCEVGDERSAAVTALLHEEGYRLFDGETPKAARAEVDIAPWSTIALPG